MGVLGRDVEVWPAALPETAVGRAAGAGRPEGMIMGYGLGVFLLAVGLILALAVTDSLANVDLTMVGWIVAAAGVLLIVLTAATAASRRRSSSVTTYADGSQRVDQRHDPQP